MLVRRFLRQAIVLAYLAVTASALLFTMTRIVFPFPFIVIFWSYGMMAPYQSDTAFNSEIIYEGVLPEGETCRVNIIPYMPYAMPVRDARESLHIYEFLGGAGLRAMFTAFGQQVLDRERKHGAKWTAIRIYRETWPRSPAGYGFLHTPVFTTRILLTTVQ